MIPRVSGTISGMDFFKKNGTWKGADTTPEKGDIIYLYSKSSSGYHVGIVADVSGGQISTIEGNSSDRVAERSYSVGNSSIVGYGCPKYVEPNPNPPSISELSIEKTNYAVGESVNFHFSSDYATKYTLGIDKGSEKRLDTIYDITNTGYSYTFQEPGEYRAYVVSINEYGYKDSNWITFYVYNKISITDIIFLQQLLLRQATLTADQAQLADYNGDGSINVLDLMLLKRALLAL